MYVGTHFFLFFFFFFFLFHFIIRQTTFDNFKSSTSVAGMVGIILLIGYFILFLFIFWVGPNSQPLFGDSAGQGQ
jgi:hypothetical protein